MSDDSEDPGYLRIIELEDRIAELEQENEGLKNILRDRGIAT